MSATGKTIVDLRALLAERFQQPLPPPDLGDLRLATDIPGIDQPLGGGLPKSAITELSSPQVSAGSALLLCALVHTAHRHGYFLALIDGRDSFDPEALDNKRLHHLLWVRCTHAIDAVKAADLLLRDANFPLVVLDLVLNPAAELRKVPQTSWYRLQRLVEATPTALLVLTRESIISSAQLKLSLNNVWRLGDLDQKQSIDRLQVQVRRAQAGRQSFA